MVGTRIWEWSTPGKSGNDRFAYFWIILWRAFWDDSGIGGVPKWKVKRQASFFCGPPAMSASQTLYITSESAQNTKTWRQNPTNIKQLNPKFYPCHVFNNNVLKHPETFTLESWDCWRLAPLSPVELEPLQLPSCQRSPRWARSIEWCQQALDLVAFRSLDFFE